MFSSYQVNEMKSRWTFNRRAERNRRLWLNAAEESHYTEKYGVDGLNFRDRSRRNIAKAREKCRTIKNKDGFVIQVLYRYYDQLINWLIVNGGSLPYIEMTLAGLHDLHAY